MDLRHNAAARCVALATWIFIITTSAAHQRNSEQEILKDQMSEYENTHQRHKRAVTESVSVLYTFLSELQAETSLSALQAQVDPYGGVDSFATDMLSAIADFLPSSSAAEVTQLIQSIQHLGVTVFRLLTSSAAIVNSGALTVIIQKTQTSYPEFYVSFHNSNQSSQIIIPEGYETEGNVSGIVAYSIGEPWNTNMTSPVRSYPASSITMAILVDSNGQDAHVSSEEGFVMMMEATSRSQWQLQECMQLDVSTGSWSSSGCKLSVKDGEDICICPEMAPSIVFLVDQDTLNVLSWFGCLVTAIACLSTSLVIIGYRLLQTVRSYIRMSFLSSLGAAEALFLVGIRWSDVPALCYMFAISLHMTVLMAFGWLLGYILFLGNDMRSKESKHISLTALNGIGWLLPVVIVATTLIGARQTYKDTLYCWIASDNHLNMALIIPALSFALMSFVILMYVIYVYITTRDPSRKYALAVTWSGIRSCMVLLPLLTLTWLFGAIAVIKKTIGIQVVFGFTNTLLGVFVFLFMCFLNEEIRRARKVKQSSAEKRKKKKPGSGSSKTEEEEAGGDGDGDDAGKLPASGPDGDDARGAEQGAEIELLPSPSPKKEEASPKLLGITVYKAIPHIDDEKSEEEEGGSWPARKSEIQVRPTSSSSQKSEDTVALTKHAEGVATDSPVATSHRVDPSRPKSVSDVHI